MTGELDPLAAVRVDAARLDALAAAASLDDDPALLLLAEFRGHIDAAVAGANSPDLRQDAALLDALSAGHGLPRSADPAMELLQALRAAVDGVTVPAAVEPPPLPATPLVVVGDRVDRRRRRALRAGVAAGSVALALSMSGVAAAAYASHPGGSLYGLRAQTFGRTDDDPVAAEQVLSDLQKQAAVAVDNPVAAAKARADVTKLHHYLAAEHDPAATQSIAASASVVVTTVAALPAPTVVVQTRSTHPTATTPAARAARAAQAIAPSAPASAGGAPSAAVPIKPVPTPPQPDDSAVLATPSPSASDVPTGAPSTDSPTGTPSDSPSPSGSADPSTTPSGTPSAATSASSSPTDVPTTTAAPVVYRSPVVVKTTKPRAKPRKKKVTATLMTAQLPSSGLPQR